MKWSRVRNWPSPHVSLNVKNIQDYEVADSYDVVENTRIHFPNIKEA